MILPFNCESGHLPGRFSGFHDGIGFWTINTAYHQSHDEQFLVSVHERLHQQLLTTTPWGVLTSAFGTLFEQTGRESAYQIFQHLAMASRDVHECYATLLSIGPDLDTIGQVAISGEYVRIYQRAASLRSPLDDQWAKSSLFIANILRACMAPKGLTEFLPRSLPDWSVADLPMLAAMAPDRRLAEVERRVSEVRECDEQFHTRLVAPSRGNYADVLASHHRVSAVFDRIGMPLLSAEDFANLARMAVAHLEPSEAIRYEILTAPQESPFDEIEDQQRERIEFRDRPLRAVEIDGSALTERWQDFAAYHPEIGLHTCIFWLRGDLLARQFDMDATVPDGHVLGIMAVAETDQYRSGELAIRLLSGEFGPGPFARLFRDRDQPLIVVTTLSTLMDAPDQARMDEGTLYALIDIPLVPLLELWRDSAGEVVWSSWWIDGTHPMYAFIFEIPQNPGVVVVHLTSSAGRQLLLRWLTDPVNPNCRRHKGFGDQHVSWVNILVQHLTRTWWFIDHRSGRPSAESRET